MLVKLNSDGTVARYPYSKTDLSVDHPDISFPEACPPDGYEELGVFPVLPTDPGAPPEGKQWMLAAEPTKQPDGTWAQAWIEQTN